MSMKHPKKQIEVRVFSLPPGEGDGTPPFEGGIAMVIYLSFPV